MFIETKTFIKIPLVLQNLLQMLEKNYSITNNSCTVKNNRMVQHNNRSHPPTLLMTLINLNNYQLVIIKSSSQDKEN